MYAIKQWIVTAPSCASSKLALIVMEIPSSSPLYTPLKEAAFKECSPLPPELCEPLFPANEPDSPSLIEEQIIDESQNASHLDLPELPIDLQLRTQPTPNLLASPHTSGAATPLESISRNTTIYSDDESEFTSDQERSSQTCLSFPTQEIDPHKSTQNYLEELLTDSLLESLPLPPAKRAKLRVNLGRGPARPA